MTQSLLVVSGMANAGLLKDAPGSLVEGPVGQTADLQVSPPCVLPPLLLGVTSASGLGTALS